MVEEDYFQDKISDSFFFYRNRVGASLCSMRVIVDGLRTSFAIAIESSLEASSANWMFQDYNESE